MTVGALPRGGAAGGLRFDIGKAARKALAVGIEQRPGDGCGAQTLIDRQVLVGQHLFAQVDELLEAPAGVVPGFGVLAKHERGEQLPEPGSPWKGFKSAISSTRWTRRLNATTAPFSTMAVRVRA